VFHIHYKMDSREAA